MRTRGRYKRKDGSSNKDDDEEQAAIHNRSDKPEDYLPGIKYVQETVKHQRTQNDYEMVQNKFVKWMMQRHSGPPLVSEDAVYNYLTSPETMNRTNELKRLNGAMGKLSARTIWNQVQALSHLHKYQAEALGSKQPHPRQQGSKVSKLLKDMKAREREAKNNGGNISDMGTPMGLKRSSSSVANGSNENTPQKQRKMSPDSEDKENDGAVKRERYDDYSLSPESGTSVGPSSSKHTPPVGDRNGTSKDWYTYSFLRKASDDLRQCGQELSPEFAMSYRDLAWFLSCHFFGDSSSKMLNVTLSDVSYGKFPYDTDTDADDDDKTKPYVLSLKPKLNIGYAARHVDVTICPVSAIGMMLCHRFDVEQQPLPDFFSKDAKQWQDILLYDYFTTKTQPLDGDMPVHRRQKIEQRTGIKPTTEETNHVLTTSQYLMSLGIPVGAVNVESLFGTTWDSSNDQHLLRLVRAMAGVDPQSSTSPSFLPRDLEPDPKLVDQIFPQASELLEKVETELAKHPKQHIQRLDDAKTFLTTLLALRHVILQDAALLMPLYPRLSIWSHPVFKDEQFAVFAMQVRAGQPKQAPWMTKIEQKNHDSTPSRQPQQQAPSPPPHPPQQPQQQQQHSAPTPLPHAPPQAPPGPYAYPQGHPGTAQMMSQYHPYMPPPMGGMYPMHYGGGGHGYPGMQWQQPPAPYFLPPLVSVPPSDSPSTHQQTQDKMLHVSGYANSLFMSTATVLKMLSSTAERYRELVEHHRAKHDKDNCAHMYQQPEQAPSEDEVNRAIADVQNMQRNLSRLLGQE